MSANNLRADWTGMALRRLAVCRDDLREPVNATERAHMSGDIPYWGANAVQDYVNRAKVSRPVVLLGEDGAPFYDRNKPVAFYIDQPIWPNNHIHVLVPKPEVDGRWLAHALNSVEYSTVISGSTRDKLTQGAMMAIQLLVPPLDEQRAIADYLDREAAQIDALVAKQEEFIGLLRERRSRAREALAHRVTVGARLRWVLSEIDRRAGSRADDLPLFSVSIDWGVRRRDETTDKLSRAEDLSHYKVCLKGDIVVNRMRAFQGALGVASSDGIVSPDYAVLRVVSEVDPQWLAELMRTRAFVGEIILRLRGIGGTDSSKVRTPRINTDDLLGIRADVPELALQRTELATLVTETTRIDALISKAEEHIALAKERRSALITAVVTGQIDVRTARKAS